MGVGGDEGLSEQLCSQLSGQSVNDYLQTILLFVSSDLEERFLWAGDRVACTGSESSAWLCCLGMGEGSC